MSDETKWIDALSEPAITLASYVWKKDPAETWGILSRAIQNEELSSYLPLTEFQEYIRFFIPPISIQPVLPIAPTKVEIDEEWIANLKKQAEKLQHPIQSENAVPLSIKSIKKKTDKSENSSYQKYEIEGSKTKSQEKSDRGWSDFIFFVFVLIVHSFIWRNWDIPPDASILFFIVSVIVSIFIVAIPAWIILQIRKK